MNSLKRYLTVASCLFALGGLGACTQAGETTAIGAAAGGALGAGLGAVIGSQTGSAGSGLAVGAVAGTATGSLIGNALQAQDEAIRTQDEAIERQERIIAAQRSQIEELKKINQDLSDGPSNISSGSRASNGIRLNPPLNPPLKAPVAVRHGNGVYSGSGTRSPERSMAAAAPKPVLRPSFAEVTGAPSDFGVEVAPSARAAMKPEKPVMVAKGFSAPDVKEGENGIRESDLVTTADTSFAKSLDRALDDTGVVTEPAPSVVGADATGASLGTGTEGRGSFAWEEEEVEQAAVSGEGSDDCNKADAEVRRIQKDTQLADKLFHYRRALRLCPDRAEFHNGLGEVYVSLNREKDADFEFREALRIDPGHSAAKKNLAGLANKW